MSAILHALQWLASLWPGFALLGCLFLGLNRRTCALLAAAYGLEALLVGLLAITTDRLQFVWVVTDCALAAAVVVVPGHALALWIIKKVQGQRIGTSAAYVRPASI